MKRIATFIIALMLLTSPSWALKSLGGAGSGGGGGGSNPIFVHALSGATPTVVVNSATVPATDVQNFPLTTNVTSITLPAAASIADGEIVHLKIIQGAGAYTLSAGTANTVLTAGAGATLANLVPGGCPAIGAVSGNELIYDVLYLSSITEYEVMGCETNPAQANGAPPTGTAGGDLSGTYPNPIVINGSNMAGSASIPDSALATPHLSSGTNTIQASVGSGNFTSLTVSQDATINGATGAATVDGILTKSIPTLPVSASALSYSGTAFSWVPYFPNPLSATGDLLVGVTNVNTAPTRLPDVAVGSVLLSGGVGVNPSYGSVPAGAIPANPVLSATNSVLGTAGSAQPVLFEDAPSWMHYLCDGSESDPNPSGSVNVQGVHCYPTLTVSATNTLNVTFTASSGATSTDKPNGAFIAYVQGACNIAGTITASGLTPNNIDGFGGSSGGAGGWGVAAGPAGQTNSVLPGGTSAAAIAAGGSSATSGNPGGNGNTPTASGIRDVLQAAPAWSTCGGSPGGQGGSSGANPGLGGGCVELICGSINFTGTINVSGSAGVAGGVSTGGGGGGGGGVVLLAARSVTNSGTITLTGGAGGAAGSGTSTAGGNGGTGWSKVFTLN